MEGQRAMDRNLNKRLHVRFFFFLNEIGTREVVVSLSVETFKTSLDKVLCSKGLNHTDLPLC